MRHFVWPGQVRAASVLAWDNAAIVAQTADTRMVVRSEQDRFVCGRSTLDAYLTIASTRVVRSYTNEPIPDDALHRILQAGRVTGSSVNRQEWKFYIVRSRDRLHDLGNTVFAPDNIKGCVVAVGVTTTAKTMFDAGRCAQDMILAAWAEGIGSCPNGVRDTAVARSLLHIPSSETIVTILSFGYPAHRHKPNPDDIDGILQRVDRRPLEELVVWVD